MPSPSMILFNVPITFRTLRSIRFLLGALHPDVAACSTLERALSTKHHESLTGRKVRDRE